MDLQEHRILIVEDEIVVAIDLVIDMHGVARSDASEWQNIIPYTRA